MSDSLWHHGLQPTRLPVPRILQARTLEWVAIFFSQSEVKSESEVAQSCPTLSNPMDCSPPGSSVHGISQARVLEWGAIAFSDDKPRQHIKRQRHYSADKGLYSQSYGFPSSHVWMWDLYHKEGWAPKNCCFWTVVLEETLKSPLDYKEINQSMLKEINPEYSLEVLLLKLKLQYFGHLMRRADWLEKIGKDWR